MAYGVATNNPFDLLGDDDDPVQVAVSAPAEAKKVEAKKPAKAEEKAGAKAPVAHEAPAAAKGVREARGGKGKGGGRGGYSRDDVQDGEVSAYQGRGGKGGKGDRGKGRGKGYYSGGGGGGGDGEERRAPRRDHDRRSGTGRGNEIKRNGAGRGNWGSEGEQISTEKAGEVEKGDGEKGDDDKAEKPEGEEGAVEAVKEEEDNEMTLEEYEKSVEQKRLEFKNQFKAGATDSKVDTSAFAEMAIVEKPAEEDQVLVIGAKATKAKAAKTAKAVEKEVVETNFHIPREESFGPRKGGKGDGRKGGKGASGLGGRGGSRGGRGGGKAYQAPTLSDESAFPTLGGK